MSGEGCIASRPAGAPGAEAREFVGVHALTKLCADGVHRVLLVMPHAGSEFDGMIVQRVLDVDQAERLGRDLLEYSALVRDRIGLDGGQVMP